MKVKAKQPFEGGNYKLAIGKVADMPEELAKPAVEDGTLEEISDKAFNDHLTKGQKTFDSAQRELIKQAEKSRQAALETRTVAKTDKD